MPKSTAIFAHFGALDIKMSIWSLLWRSNFQMQLPFLTKIQFTCFYWNLVELFPWIQLTICHYWFRLSLIVDHATSHYLIRSCINLLMHIRNTRHLTWIVYLSIIGIYTNRIPAYVHIFLLTLRKITSSMNWTCAKSSVKFKVHTGRNNDDFYLNSLHIQCWHRLCLHPM